MAHLKPDDCLSFVTEVLSVLRSATEHERVCSLVVDRVVRLFGCRTCAMVIVDPTSEYLHIAHSHGISHTFVKEFRRRFATDAVGRLLWTGVPVFVRDSAAQGALAAELQLEEPFASCLCVPIIIDERAIGYLHVDSGTPEAFEQSDARVLQGFADFAGLALNKCRLAEENLRLDTVDHETGLRKYPAFLERLEEACAHAAATEEPLAVALLDVDNYKHVALTYGTDRAKLMLREMADEVRLMLRPMDWAGRYGFDEIILLRADAALADAARDADDLRRRIEARSYAGKEIRSSVSIGVAAYLPGPEGSRDLLLRVREALYEAQRAGRNRVWTAG